MTARCSQCELSAQINLHLSPIRTNEAHVVAARAMLGLPPAVAATPAADITDEIATLLI